MKVALVHDYLREYGDAERVLQVLHRMYPDAPVYVAFVDYPRLGEDAKRFADWDIRTTVGQRLWGMPRYYHASRALLPYFWESLDLSTYDLVISSSGNYFSQSVLTRPDTLHISYCHTPPRYLWERSQSIPAYWRWYQTWVDTRLRQYDFYAAQRVDRFVTNSEGVARRIKKFYRRSTEVIAPPVQVQGKGEAGGEYYLYIGPLTRRQQVELVVAACTRLDRPLWVVGDGSDAERLQTIAGRSIRFLGSLPDEATPSLYANARALIFPRVDADFGFPPVEALGYGVPVIASALSGIKEIILNYRTGLLYDDSTVEGLCDAIVQFEGLRFSSSACIERAKEFAEPVFRSKLEWFIAQALDEHKQKDSIAE